MYEIQRRVLLHLPPLFGVDLSITNEIVLLWGAALATFALLFFACRRREIVARGMYRNLFEALIEIVEREIVQEGMGKSGARWAPFVLSLFFFVLLCNLLGLVPLPSVFKPVTSSLSVTAALAALVFILTVVLNVRAHGLGGFLRRFLPAGLPVWIGILVAPIEVISWLARPFSLAIRLFANMLVGHHLIFIFIGLEMLSAWYFKSLPFVGAVLMSAFELFVCFIQAFIFAMLAGIYIRDAVEAH